MTTPRTTAKKLVSETEFRLINDSFPPQIASLSDKGLLQRLERARKARDKYHNQVERQQGKAGDGPERGAASSASLKEKIFEETLARFERQTAKAGDAGMKAAANTPARSVEGKKASGEKAGSQGKSKASVKMANKAAAKGGAKPVPKSGKGKGGVTNATPQGRYQGVTPNANLR